MKKLSATLVFLVSIYTCTYAQVKIGGTPAAPHASSVLEVDGGTTKGLLLPRMSTTNMNNIPSPANGLLIYSNTDHSVYLRSNNSWGKMGGFKLPFLDTISSALFTAFDVVTEGHTGIAIRGRATNINGTGVVGSSTQYIGVRGSGNVNGGYFSSTNGTGGLFSSTNGYALVTDGGNVGINNTTPDLAKLVVDGKVGSSTAMFGSGTPGVVIETDPGGIAFNSYLNGTARKYMDNGFSSLIRQNNASGDLEIFQAPAGGAINSTVIYKRNIAFDRYGKVGIGGAEPISALTFPKELGDKINFWETGTDSRFGIGIQPSLMQLFTSTSAADVAIGTGSSETFTERFRFTGDGKLGIATNAPTARLHINGIGTSEFAMIVNDENPTIQLQSSGVDKGTLQLNGDDIRLGTNVSNAAGRVILRSGGIDRVFLDNAGNFSIGTTAAAPGYIFRVGGRMIAEEIRVKPEANWPDYVFAKQYKLASLENLEAYIEQHKHLPNIPSAETVQQQGIAVGEMQNKLMEKVEELTLYLIKANKDIKALQEELKAIKNK